MESVPSLERFLLAFVLAIQAGLLAYLAVSDSPTVDEPGHLAAVCHYWETGEFDVYRVNPPLVKLIVGLPVHLAADVKSETLGEAAAIERFPGARRNLEIGDNFANENAANFMSMLTLARLMLIPFSFLGGLVCFLWARELHGREAGWFALSLWCCEPLILGHASLLTMDVPGAAVGVLTCYRFWKWLQEDTWLNCGWCALALGVSLLTKFTGIIHCVMFPLFAWLFHRRSLDSRFRPFLQLLVGTLITLLVINVGYGFDRSFRPLKDFLFVSESLSGIPRTSTASGTVGNRFSSSRIGFLPVPVPACWLSGLDTQKRDFEFRWHCYLDGDWKQGGWWYFYLFGLGYKLQIGTIALLGIAVIHTLMARGYLRIRFLRKLFPEKEFY